MLWVRYRVFGAEGLGLGLAVFGHCGAGQLRQLIKGNGILRAVRGIYMGS